MTPINPITGALVTSAMTPRQQAVEREKQIRREQAARRNIAVGGDRYEHTVANADAVAPVQDQRQERPPSRQRPKPKRPGADKRSEGSTLDVKG